MRSRRMRSRRGRWGRISNKPITDRFSTRSHASQPAATMREPAMPAKRACGRRWRSALMSCAPKLSPDCSPATRTMSTERLPDDSNPLAPRRGVVEERDQRLQLRLILRQLLDLLGGLDQLQLRAVQDAIRIANVSD